MIHPGENPREIEVLAHFYIGMLLVCCRRDKPFSLCEPFVLSGCETRPVWRAWL